MNSTNRVVRPSASVALASGAVTPQLMRERERGGEKSNARTARASGLAFADAERASGRESLSVFAQRGSFADSGSVGTSLAKNIKIN